MVREININQICKVEGHANLKLKIDGNKVKQCELEANEGARFFEALVLGKKLKDVQEVVSRICGICSSAHSVACINALEEALGLKSSENQVIIREMLMIGERIRSHATHLYFLALPDYLGFSSALTMSGKHKDKLDDALSLISLGNEIIEVFGGREMHPFLGIRKNEHINGKRLDELKERLENSKAVIRRTIEIFSKFKYPAIERDSDYLSLKDKEYATISGKIFSKSGKIVDDDYGKHLKENIKEYATSKFTLKDGKPYIVGAIARITNNHEQLDSEGKSWLKNINLKNPFHNNICQAVELLHFSGKAIKLIDKYTGNEDKQELKIKAGKGISAVEAPRGTLFHEYRINEKGEIDYCNIITPTCQNLNMMELDISQYVNQLLLKNIGKEALVFEIEKLIRAYDPCFSCSTHFLKVDWL